jgi:hypothetical protein
MTGVTGIHFIDVLMCVARVCASISREYVTPVIAVSFASVLRRRPDTEFTQLLPPPGPQVQCV